jgi:hypothetical protein
MAKIISFDEIKRRYDGKWVLIAHTALDRNLEVLEGEVIACASDVETIYRSLSLVKGREASIEYIGQAPEDFAAIL